jgi:hypothetical protein
MGRAPDKRALRASATRYGKTHHPVTAEPQQWVSRHSTHPNDVIYDNAGAGEIPRRTLAAIIAGDGFAGRVTRS